MGVINKNSKNFRIVDTFNRDSNTISKFIKQLSQKAILLMTPWAGYNWLNSTDSGYLHFKFNHGMGQFRAGLESTSHIEAVWNVIKSKIKNTYYVIPSKNLFKFVREAEYK